MRTYYETLTDNLRVEIREYNSAYYELYVEHRRWTWSEWEWDDSKFPDPLVAFSSMEVYGTMEYEIKPAYARYIWRDE